MNKMKFIKSTKFKISLVYAATVLVMCLFYWALLFGVSKRLITLFPEPVEIDEDFYKIPVEDMPSSQEISNGNDSVLPDNNEKDLSVEEFDEITDSDESNQPSNPHSGESVLPPEVSTPNLPVPSEDDLNTIKDLSTNYSNIMFFVEERLPQISLIIAFVVSFASFGVGYLFSLYFLKPINKLQTSINYIDLDNIENDFNLNLTQRKDEFGMLARSYDEMIKRLNQSYQSQKQFIQDASHELKTPLSIIQTNSELLQRSITDLSRNDTESLKSILKSTERMSALIKDMLLLEKINYVKESEKIDLVELIKNSLSDFEDLMKNKNIKIKLKFHEDKLYFQANEKLIKRLFDNLISNAIKYNKNYGKIIISSQSQPGDKRNFIIKIKDTGIGINPEELDKIGERFYRTDSSRSRDTGGSGLGLAIVNEIAQMYEIGLDIKSKPDQGTTFSLKFNENRIK